MTGPEPPLITHEQRRTLFGLLKNLEKATQDADGNPTVLIRSDRILRLRALSRMAGRPVASMNELTDDEYHHARTRLTGTDGWPPEERVLEAQCLTQPLDPWKEDAA